MLRHLPRESAYATAVLGPPPVWDIGDYLLALLVDEQRVANWLTRRAHFKGTPPPPRFLPRPQLGPKADPVSKVAGIRARLSKFYGEGGAHDGS